jgi:hypothetical protein
LKEVTTSTTVGRPLARASAIAPRISPGASTRLPPTPMARAISAKFISEKLLAMVRLPWPCLTQPRALLFKITVTMGISSSRAVMMPFIAMPKPPSPVTAITWRSGKTSLPASAAGTA